MTSPTRPPWRSLPEAVRAGVEQVLGARVATAVGMSDGWSPGSADRVVTEDGRRAFVKAASADVNRVTVRLHRREAAVLAALSGSGAAPDLLGTVAEGPWFALVAEDLGGRHPEPGSAADTAAVLDAVASLPDPAPAPMPDGADDPPDVLRDAAAGWTRLLDDDAAQAVPGGEDTARRMAALAAGASAAADGTALVHGDLRLDNVLIVDGRARLVDWPWAGTGAPWFDAVCYALDEYRLAARRGPLPLAHPLLADLPADVLRAAVAALAGYFLDGSRRPAEPGLEGVRAFQREQGLVLLQVLDAG